MDVAEKRAPLGLAGKGLPPRIRKVVASKASEPRVHSSHHDEPAGRTNAALKTSHQVSSKQKEQGLDTPQVTSGRSTPKTTKRKDPATNPEPKPAKRARSSQQKPAKRNVPSGPLGCSKCRYSGNGCGACRGKASLPKTGDIPRFTIVRPANPNDPRCDLLGLLVQVPAEVFQMDIPGYYYNGVVTKLEEKKSDAIEMIFEDDLSKYWFPVKDVRQWIKGMKERDVDPECRIKRTTPPASIEPNKADEFAATVLTSLSRSTQQQNTDVSDRDVVSSPPNDKAGGEMKKNGMNVSDKQAASVLESIMNQDTERD